MPPIMGGTTHDTNFTNFSDIMMMMMMMADMADPQSETWVGLWKFPFPDQ
jgi:hypothetical protein